MTPRPLITHVIYRLGVGGMENGLVNLINEMPPDRYRHAIVCLEQYTDYRRRLQRPDVEVIALGKREGKDPGLYVRLLTVLRRLRPDVLHTRNLPTLEGQVVGALLGIRGRVHGEHGRDVYDLYGRNRKYNLLRGLVRPFVHHYIAVSKDLERWLLDTVGAPRRRTSQIYNGVDTRRFRPHRNRKTLWPPEAAFPRDAFVLGGVGRMATVKDYGTLVRAFLHLIGTKPYVRDRLRLVLIGDGASREECRRMLNDANAAGLAWLPGERSDVPELMRGMDLFVLPSLGEGISNSILEAMATGLPVVATAVGGNPELVQPHVTGMLVPPGEPTAMAEAIHCYLQEPKLALQHGEAARQRVESSFSIQSMVDGYTRVYDAVLGYGLP